MKGLPFPSIIFAQSLLNPWRLASNAMKKRFLEEIEAVASSSEVLSKRNVADGKEMNEKL